MIACIDAEVDMCTPKAFELRGVVASAALIEELAARLDIELPRAVWHQLRVIEMAEAPVARLRAHLAAIQETITIAPEQFDDPAARQALEDALLVEIMDMLPTARPSDPGRSAAARKRTVDRARELMHGSGERALSLLEVCKAVGASPRKLGYCFQEVLGTSPMHYWRAMRLNRVRRDLKRGGGGVSLRRRRAARLLALQPVLARLQAPLLRAALGDAAPRQACGLTRVSGAAACG